MTFNPDIAIADVTSWGILLAHHLRHLERTGNKKACQAIESKLERMRHEVGLTYGKIKEKERTQPK